MNLLKTIDRLMQGFGVLMLVSITLGGVLYSATAAAKPAKVVLLLHGKASNLRTWIQLP